MGATKQSLSESHQSNHSRLKVCNEIATPSARNDTEGYYYCCKHMRCD
jgi:hypothetical protein